MDKETFVEESPESVHRPRDSVLSDQEAGVAVVDINRIENVYR